jgi:hypothetical protein
VLEGNQEVPPVVTDATGTGILTVNVARDAIAFTLTYQGIATEEEEEVVAAHIHAAERGVNGDIIFFLCADTPPDGEEVDPCPEPSATISGTLTEANFRPSDPPVATFAGAIVAIIAGRTYFNVHSTPDFPAGEIRGQIENPPAPEE